MLQILGQSMLIATRMDGFVHDVRASPVRPVEREATQVAETRRGWLHRAGLLL